MGVFGFVGQAINLSLSFIVEHHWHARSFLKLDPENDSAKVAKASSPKQLEGSLLKSHIERESTNFIRQHIEASWRAGFKRVFAFDH